MLAVHVSERPDFTSNSTKQVEGKMTFSLHCTVQLLQVE